MARLAIVFSIVATLAQPALAEKKARQPIRWNVYVPLAVSLLTGMAAVPIVESLTSPDNTTPPERVGTHERVMPNAKSQKTAPQRTKPKADRPAATSRRGAHPLSLTRTTALRSRPVAATRPAPPPRTKARPRTPRR